FSTVLNLGQGQLFALGQIANMTEEDSDILLYHALRDYALDHSESVEIMAAID
ncbi:antirestriction protein, partial [Salmonella enterica]|nr:antirestriction protein [Salmonella enterica]